MLKRISKYNPAIIISYILFKLSWSIWTYHDMSATILRIGAIVAVGFYSSAIVAFAYYNLKK